MEVLLSGVGLTPLVTHNERLQDALDPLTQQIAKISGKRKKTEADLLDLSRLEFEGGLYMNGNGPSLPAMNIFRSLQEGAVRMRRGKDVLRGVRPDPGLIHVDLVYDGPRDVEALWDERDKFSLRKGVVVSGRRVTRTRPIYPEWAFAAPFVVDETIWDFGDLAQAWKFAGLYAGLCEMRPIYGQYEATAKQMTPELRKWITQQHDDFSKFVEIVRNGTDSLTARHGRKG